ncbi:MAG: conjugal transfer protein TraX [Clostridia bacterium]|nr:conjugal transfer protein TraX [Clostridia bacterium]
MQNIKHGLSAQKIKLIAIAAMTIDHLVWVLFPGYQKIWWLFLLHSIGRITAPVMCYFISEGYHYTRDPKCYAMRLGIFALVSHFAYNFAFGIPMLPFSTGEIFNQTGVMWAFFLGVIALMLCDDRNEKLPQWAKVLCFLLCCALAFPADWSCIAVLVIAAFYSNRGNFKKQMVMLVLCVSMYAAVYCMFIDFAYGLLQMMVVLAIPILSLYDGTRGKGSKWFFYWYYPAHLIVCGIIRILLHGNIPVLIGG